MIKKFQHLCLLLALIPCSAPFYDEDEDWFTQSLPLPEETFLVDLPEDVCLPMHSETGKRKAEDVLPDLGAAKRMRSGRQEDVFAYAMQDADGLRALEELLGDEYLIASQESGRDEVIQPVEQPIDEERSPLSEQLERIAEECAADHDSDLDLLSLDDFQPAAAAAPRLPTILEPVIIPPVHFSLSVNTRMSEAERPKHRIKHEAKDMLDALKADLITWRPLPENAYKSLTESSAAVQFALNIKGRLVLANEDESKFLARVGALMHAVTYEYSQWYAKQFTDVVGDFLSELGRKRGKKFIDKLTAAFTLVAEAEEGVFNAAQIKMLTYIRPDVMQK